jgi:GT2 family glycosyltransferase
MRRRLKLSVIIPTRDTRELTLNCLASLWLADPQPDEVVVVDDGGLDCTAAAVVRKYPRHVVVRLPEPLGFAAAVNHGVSRASGDLLLLLNSDTEVEPSALAAVAAAFSDDDRLGIVGGSLFDPDGAPQWSGGRRPSALWCFALASGLPALLGRSALWRRLRAPSGTSGAQVEWVAGTAMVVRREVWEKVGPLDNGYRFYCQDLDLCYRARDAGWSVAVLPAFRVLHHGGGTISSFGGAVGTSHPALMWSDLIRFAGSRWGEASARRAGLAFRIGGKLRLLGRSLAAPIVPGEAQERWRAATSAYTDALKALSAAQRGPDHTAPPSP